MRSNIHHKVEMFFSAFKKLASRRASFVVIPDLEFPPRICLTSSSASIAPKSHEREERPQALVWVSLSRIGLWNVMGAGSKLNQKRGKAQRLRSGYLFTVI